MIIDLYDFFLSLIIFIMFRLMYALKKVSSEIMISLYLFMEQFQTIFHLMFLRKKKKKKKKKYIYIYIYFWETSMENGLKLFH